MIKFLSPSVVVTYCGLSLALLGGILVLQGNQDLALLLLVLSGICDMFDGRFARLFKRSPEEKLYGIEIDSLCDMVSFGFFPALFAYSLGMKEPFHVVILLAYLLAVLTRLGHFNVMELSRQDGGDHGRETFIGFPVTSVVISFPFVYVSKFVLGGYFVHLLSLYMCFNTVSFLVNVRIKKLGMRGFITLVLLALVGFTLLFRYSNMATP